MASMAGRNEVMLDMNAEVTSLCTTATNLLETVGRLHNDVAG